MDCLPLLPHQLPHQSELFRDYVENFSKLKSFFEHTPDLKSAASYSKKLQFGEIFYVVAEELGLVGQLVR